MVLTTAAARYRPEIWAEPWKSASTGRNVNKVGGLQERLNKSYSSENLNSYSTWPHILRQGRSFVSALNAYHMMNSLMTLMNMYEK
jgi:hypothetical protein